MSDIRGFFGIYRFLSNFYPSPIVINDKEYATVEHFYQASKARDDEDHEYVRLADSAGNAKRLGKRIQLREDWDKVKVHVMLEGLIAKFEQNELLKQRLIDTEQAYLEETNHWGDTFWGVCNGKGCNHLGKLLMFVRNTF